MIQYHLEPSLSPLGELCLWIWPHSLHFCRATFLAFLATSILLVSSCFFWWLEWENSWVQHDRKQGEFHPLSIKSWQLGEAPWSFTHRASHTYNDAHLSLRRLVVTLWEKVDLKKNQRYENNKRELRPIQGVEIRWHLAVWDLEQSKSHKLIIIKNVCQAWPDMLLQSDGFAPPCKCPKSSPEPLLLTWMIEPPNITNRFNRGFWPFINSPKMDLKKPSRLRVES